MSLKLPVAINANAPKKAEEINGFIKEILSLINQHAICSIKVQKNIKLILTEFITNAIKHVGNNDNLISIRIENSVIEIYKTDNSLPFETKLFSKDSHENSPIASYYLQQLSENCWKFFLISSKQESRAIHYIPEHFGFEIITRASSIFTYEYNKDTCENIFKAVLEI